MNTATSLHSTGQRPQRFDRILFAVEVAALGLTAFAAAAASALYGFRFARSTMALSPSFAWLVPALLSISPLAVATDYFKGRCGPLSACCMVASFTGLNTWILVHEARFPFVVWSPAVAVVAATTAFGEIYARRRGGGHRRDT